MKLGFDLDGTLCTINTVNLIQIANCKDAAIKKQMEEWYYRDQKSLLDANLFLSEKDEMFIITGRPDYLHNITKKWVDRFYPNATLVLVGRKTMTHADDCKTGWLVLAKLKADMIIKLGLDIYFDDEP